MSWFKFGAVTALMTWTIGCTGSIGSSSQAINAAELPPVEGCDSVASPAARSSFRATPVSGVEDLYLVQSGGRSVCIDSMAGVRQMVTRVNGILHTRELASSNPMPGTDPSDDSSSNPMPGTDPTGPDNTNSNPMPGTDH